MERLKSALGVAFAAFLGFGLFVGTYAAAVEFYALPAIKWSAIGAYALLAAGYAYRGHWGKGALLACGILAVPAYYPFFAGIEAKAREGANRGNLGAMRSVVEQAKWDTGSYPAEPSGFNLRLSLGHPATRAVRIFDGSVTERASLDSGTWAYDPATGEVFIACTHLDSKGSVWSSY